MDLNTPGNIPLALQVANMGKIQGANFKLEGNRKAFIVKNLGSKVTLKVCTAGGDIVETSFEPGWNRELLYEVITDASSMNLQYGY